MKKLIALFAVFCLPSAYAACPNLEGHWNCNTDGGQASTMDVTQEPIPGGTLYKVVNQEGELFEYPADGVLHNVEDDQSTGSVLVTCSANGDIHSDRDARAKDQSYYGRIIEDLKLTNANEIQSYAKTRIEFYGNVEEREYQSVCRKN